MPLILNIDTATEHASVSLSRNGSLLTLEANPHQKDHAAFIQPAIQQMMNAAGLPLPSIDAIAVSNGPGSYTGLRVGLATAKGLAYALDKPLILINTLEVMATAAIQHTAKTNDPKEFLFCPMIDARRMEVFTALYDYQLHTVQPPVAMILDEHSFGDTLQQHTIVFSGSGAKKFENVNENNKRVFINIQHDSSHMITIAENCYRLKTFADKAYSEPYYLKEFFTPASKLKSD